MGWRRIGGGVCVLYTVVLWYTDWSSLNFEVSTYYLDVSSNNTVQYQPVNQSILIFHNSYLIVYMLSCIINCIHYVYILLTLHFILYVHLHK